MVENWRRNKKKKNNRRKRKGGSSKKEVAREGSWQCLMGKLAGASFPVSPLSQGSWVSLRAQACPLAPRKQNCTRSLCNLETNQSIKSSTPKHARICIQKVLNQRINTKDSRHAWNNKINTINMNTSTLDHTTTNNKENGNKNTTNLETWVASQEVLF